MLGTVQMGMVAALVVVLVPMAMAGWHLSRNKMLFFSGALFISLAVGVHLSTPFFPSSLSSFFVSSLSSTGVVFDSSRHSCLSLLHDVVWNLNLSNFSSYSSSSSSLRYDKSWSWPNSSSDCNFQTLSRSDASDLLNGSWVVVAGDSQARFVALSLLRLLLADSDSFDSAKADLFKRHSNYKALIPEIGARLDFVWAPYADNLTELVAAAFGRRSPPDVLVMGAGLWHMLRVTNESDFAVSLKKLRDSVVSLLPSSPELASVEVARSSAPAPQPHLFWIGMPTLINSMLNTEEKRVKMTDERRGAYDRQLWKSRLLRQSGGPLLMLDIESLSWNCGVRCTEDGMHYDLPVYEAAVQIMLNALLIESHQKL